MALAAPGLLRRRLARGKEDPARWREKLGEATAARPEGPLAWLHAVGVGEVLALRGLIAALRAQNPDLQVLVTSTARTSAMAFDRNRPAGVIHQFLPVDTPGARARFLDHWRPDLSVWAEQDLWPGLIVETARRGIPLALVNGRMDATGLRQRQRAGRIYPDLLARFGLIAAQDAASAAAIGQLAGREIAVTGSLKPAAPPLLADPDALRQMQAALAGRHLWLAAATHAEDEAVALAAHRTLLARDPATLLILAPRLPTRGADVLANAGMPGVLRSTAEVPRADTGLLVADTMGEMGLWYRLAPMALIGGSFGPVQGHNPWEAVRLGSAVLHGPNTGHFAQDYAALDAAGGAAQVADAPSLLAALLQGPGEMPRHAAAEADKATGAVTALAADLLALMGLHDG
ncbi:glycosyltransferase N-terminal domain-containing protein [Limimaricola sp.]|uniref:3-deoxy-D-manno-octulosonic acid transferase n=1 Tax=Limimaricola sp. TaxID=2211665 RepID=UPI0025B87AB0|nr:glycosyltransferase N-terminal domain-containing protein [Limimaricola sp.]